MLRCGLGSAVPTTIFVRDQEFHLFSSWLTNIDSEPVRWHWHTGALMTPPFWAVLQHQSLSKYKTHAACVLYRNRTGREDFSELKDDNPVAVIDRNRAKIETKEAPTDEVGEIWVREKQKSDTELPDVQTYIHRKGQWNIPTKFAEF